MQFYWSRRPDGLLCSSESGVVQALIGRPAIDWEFVSNSLAYINLRTERTGFSAIRELLPGTCLCFDGVALSVEQTWLPGKHILCQRSGEIGRAHVRTPVTNAQLVSSLRIIKKK